MGEHKCSYTFRGDLNLLHPGGRHVETLIVILLALLGEVWGMGGAGSGQGWTLKQKLEAEPLSCPPPPNQGQATVAFSSPRGARGHKQFGPGRGEEELAQEPSQLGQQSPALRAQTSVSQRGHQAQPQVLP